MRLITAFSVGYLIGTAAAVAFKKIKDRKEESEPETIPIEDIIEDCNDEKDCDSEMNEEDVGDTAEPVSIIDTPSYIPSTVSSNKDLDKPYVIPPDEFAENDDYEIIDLIYYADGILADELDDPVEDSEVILGTEWERYFGVWEDDSVFVRNDSLKTDYEILRSLKTWDEVMESKPYHIVG